MARMDLRIEGIDATFHEQTAVEPSGLSTYKIRLVPRLYLLTQNRDYRKFQRQPVPTIVKRFLEDWLIDHEWRLDPGAFPVLSVHRTGPGRIPGRSIRAGVAGTGVGR